MPRSMQISTFSKICREVLFLYDIRLRETVHKIPTKGDHLYILKG